MTVAALYIDPRGPYPALLGPELCWDAERDACLYEGPWPIVAHPPCGPWGRLRHLCRNQVAELGPFAVDQVRRFRGVLEHPMHSKLFDACGMPKPGEPADRFGGRTILVSQCDFGHVARKWTWVYLVGDIAIGPLPPSREPTHWISGGRGRTGVKHKTTPVPPGMKVASAKQRQITPVAFARWLIGLAEQVNGHLHGEDHYDLGTRHQV